MGNKTPKLVTTLIIIVILSLVPCFFTEEATVESGNTTKGDEALAKIKNLKIIELGNYRIFTNIYGERNYNKILQLLTQAVPEISNDLSFAELKNKIKILILNEYGYRDFLTNIGYVYSKTPYGFALPDQNFIMVNSDLGEGTLLHEMVHILLFNDIKKAPPWIDEGIACLYEASGWKGNKIYVRNNWRLPLLKKVIDTPNYIKLSDLLKMDSFTYSGKTFPASEARYLIYYLFEKKLLGEFYREYKATRTEDYYGIKALTKTVGTSTDGLEQEWLKWVRELGK